MISVSSHICSANAKQRSATLRGERTYLPRSELIEYCCSRSTHLYVAHLSDMFESFAIFHQSSCIIVLKTGKNYWVHLQNSATRLPFSLRRWLSPFTKGLELPASTMKGKSMTLPHLFASAAPRAELLLLLTSISYAACTKRVPCDREDLLLTFCEARVSTNFVWKRSLS